MLRRVGPRHLTPPSAHRRLVTNQRGRTVRALLGVFDKTGIEEFAKGLAGLGWDLSSTGGTFATLQNAEVEVGKVEDLTGFPDTHIK